MKKWDVSNKKFSFQIGEFHFHGSQPFCTQKICKSKSSNESKIKTLGVFHGILRALCSKPWNLLEINHPTLHQQEQQENHLHCLQKFPFNQFFWGGTCLLEIPLHHILGKENYEITKFESPKHLVERSTRVVPDQPPMTAGGCLA